MVYGLHASGTPVDHSDFIGQGEMTELLVQSPYNPYEVDPPLVWNHDGGVEAKFWIIAIER